MLRQAKITDAHYELISKWWEAQKFPVIPPEALSEIGVMVSSDLEPLAAAWLYKTDSCIAWIEWIVANPKPKDRALRSQAVDAAIAALISQAQALGFKMVFTSSKNARLGKRLKDLSFQHTDSGVDHYIRGV